MREEKSAIRKFATRSCLLLHGIGEVLGRVIPEGIVDPGSVQSSDLNFVSQILTKFHSSHRIVAQSIIDRVDRNLEICHEKHMEVMTRGHPDWPVELQLIRDQPYALFSMGRLANLPRIALIGSRQANPDALSEASKLGYFLAKAGYCVVSGGAIGCDIASHLLISKSALSQMAMVILPGGILNPYPRLHQPIFEKISSNGGVIVTERFVDHKPSPKDFIVRNRLLVGLSDVIILLQGDELSGSSSTIRLALNYGKEIYVSKRSLLESPLGQRLVAEGARLIDSFQVSRLCL